MLNEKDIYKTILSLDPTKRRDMNHAFARARTVFLQVMHNLPIYRSWDHMVDLAEEGVAATSHQPEAAGLQTQDVYTAAAPVAESQGPNSAPMETALDLGVVKQADLIGTIEDAVELPAAKPARVNTRKTRSTKRQVECSDDAVTTNGTTTSHSKSWSRARLSDETLLERLRAIPETERSPGKMWNKHWKITKIILARPDRFPNGLASAFAEIGSLNTANNRKYKVRTRETILEELGDVLKLYPNGANQRTFQTKHSALYTAVIRRLKDFPKGFIGAVKSIKPDFVFAGGYQEWSEAKIVAEIRRLYKTGDDLNWGTVQYDHSALATAARRRYKQWNKALEAAELDPKTLVKRLTRR